MGPGLSIVKNLIRGTTQSIATGTLLSLMATTVSLLYGHSPLQSVSYGRCSRDSYQFYSPIYYYYEGRAATNNKGSAGHRFFHMEMTLKSGRNFYFMTVQW